MLNVLNLIFFAGTLVQPAPAGGKPAHGAIKHTMHNMQNQDNPLLQNWGGEHGGFPPFDKVKTEHFKPALLEAISQKLNETEAIADNTAAPTFDNTIAALERSGKLYNKVTTIYGVWSSNNSSPAFQAVQREMTPTLTALSDQIMLNSKLFKRVSDVYNNRSRLTPEQQRLTWDYYNSFKRAGAGLKLEDKVKLSKLNTDLSMLYNTFNEHLLADEGKIMLLESKAELAGMPDEYIAAAAAAANEAGQAGKWAIANTRSSVDPFLTFGQNRAARERVWKMFINRGDNGDKNDNNAIITQILKLRAQQAKLLGYETHAHYRLENSMAKTPDAAMKLMMQVWEPAIKRVAEEVKDMQAIADVSGDKITIQPWDYKFYAELVRRNKYAVDQNVVKQYLQLDKLREGMFWAANKNFHITFKPLNNIPVYNSDMRVWQVNDAQGHEIALFYMDPYARTGKRSGAWMNNYREQENMDGPVIPIISNNLNYIKPAAGGVTYLSWDDATTLFHEFGHALHGMLSKVTYPGLSGTNVVRDYVEFPSQLNEYWLSTPEVLSRFAVNAQGEPMPADLLKKLQASSKFNQGFATTEFLASALIDMKLHLEGDKNINPDTYERETLAALHMPKEIVMRHRTPQFGHIFSSDGYSAGYYSYLWADVLVADGYENFEEHGGPYSTEIAKKYYDNILTKGNTEDPAQLYRNFRGRDARVEALMRKRGFIN